MPELPEVETIRQTLDPEICGRTIVSLEVLTAGVLVGSSNLPVGLAVQSISRRGKYLLVRLTDDKQQIDLIIHLRMTGRLLIRKQPDPYPKHTHIRIKLSGPSESDRSPIWLIFVDPRRFGRIWVAASRDTWPQGLLGLGPEPLDDSLDVHALHKAVTRRKTSIKAVLLDQKVLAGLGNIYADEALFAAGINPARQACSLSLAEVESLLKAIRMILSTAISSKGTTLRDYADGWNRRGTFQDSLMAYGRGDACCRACGKPMQKDRIGGRTTTWCPGCQPENASSRKGGLT